MPSIDPILLALVPLGLLAMAAAVISIMRRDFKRHLRRHSDAGVPARDGAKPCVACGYDLRATTTDLCPECGFPIVFDRMREWLNEAALSRAWPADAIAPRAPAPGEKLVFVHVAPSPRQADLLVQQLRARGVWCEARPAPDDCFVILVSAGDETTARAIVDRFRRPGAGASSALRAGGPG